VLTAAEIEEWDMTGHTPGPWRYQERADAYTHIVRAEGERFICQLAQDKSGEAEANARLIAAAPDMLKALWLAHDELHHPGAARSDGLNVFEVIEEAIAKAEGRS
jgi:hypothetical protein